MWLQRLIAFPQNEDDVVQCVKYVGKHSLDVAVACGRHSYHGASSADGMIIGKDYIHCQKEDGTVDPLASSRLIGRSLDQKTFSKSLPSDSNLPELRFKADV